MSETRPEQAATSLGEDWTAIAAHAAHHDIITPAEALASWRALDEDQRANWRASADAVRMLLDARPAPELAAAMAESRKVREILAEVLGWFKPSGAGHAARVGQVAIARSYRDAGLPVPEDLRKLT